MWPPQSKLNLCETFSVLYSPSRLLDRLENLPGFFSGFSLWQSSVSLCYPRLSLDWAYDVVLGPYFLVQDFLFVLWPKNTFLWLWLHAWAHCEFGADSSCSCELRMKLASSLLQHTLCHHLLVPPALIWFKSPASTVRDDATVEYTLYLQCSEAFFFFCS